MLDPLFLVPSADTDQTALSKAFSADIARISRAAKIVKRGSIASHCAVEKGHARVRTGCHAQNCASRQPGIRKNSTQSLC